MAPGDAIDPNALIYRAVSSSRIDAATNRPKETAFLLRPASDEFPVETSLSFSTTPAGAIADLTRVRTCSMRVRDIFGLRRSFTVTEGDTPGSVQVAGMPQYGVDDALALVCAKDLRDIASACH